MLEFHVLLNILSSWASEIRENESPLLPPLDTTVNADPSDENAIL